MSKTSSKGSAGTLVALTAGGAVLVLVSAALGQGVQGPNTFQGGTGGPSVNPAGTPIYMNKGAPNPAGATADTFHKGDPRLGTTVPGGAGFLTGPKVLQAAPPASPSKATGAEPPPSPGKATGMGNFESKQSGNATVPVGPRAAGYLKSPTKGDPKAKIGDIKGKIKGEVIGEDGARSCATGKAC